MSFSAARTLGGLLIAATLSASVSLALPSEPWLDGAFVAPAADVARAAARIEHAVGNAVILLRDDYYRLGADGRMTHTRRWVYRVLTPAGLDVWSTSEVSWAPWHQAKPELRVRVIDEQGGEAWLDADAISDLTAEQAGLEGQLRLLRAPLSLEVGAVVEEQVVIRDEQPLFAAGVSVQHRLVMPVPTYRVRLTLEAPKSLPLRYVIRGLSLQPDREVFGGRVRWTFEAVDLPSPEAAEVGLPSDEPRYPYVAFSTGASWVEVADAYASTVLEQFDAAEAQATRAWLPNRGAPTPLERVADVLEGLRGNARYRANSLASSPLRPSSPIVTLRRGYGDSQDLATVLVAALQAEGISAHVALLRAGYEVDVEPELPGIGGFNRALVYIPTNLPIWVDPSDRFSRAGELASDLQDRLALIAKPKSRRLVRTPVATPADNRMVTEIEVTMADSGPARVVETSTHYGVADRRQRLLLAQIDRQRRRLGYLAYVKSTYRAEALGEVEEAYADDLSMPFRLRLEALQAGRAWTAGDEGALAIDLRDLITTLPRALLVGDDPRRADFIFHEPFVAEWRYRIHPPPQMYLRDLPKDASRSLGSGRLIQDFQVDGTVVLANFRLDSGPRRISADRFQAYREAIQEVLLQEPLVLWFEPRESRRKR